MCARTLNFLEREIHNHRPATILEFGSGVSTVCLAQFMQDIHGKGGSTRVYSLEQDANTIERTRTKLQSAGLDEHVRIFHAPLATQQIHGRATTCYGLPADFLKIMRPVQPQFLIIDGPAAEDGARFGTLPLVRSIVPAGARFYLDDALRDSELSIAQQWAEFPDVIIDGLLPTEKGLLLGRLKDQVNA
jgi:hypothetical protein